MSRRFQFSLRTLLVATAVSCVCFGGRQIYFAHFADFVQAESPLVGQPIRLTGRFTVKNGADTERFLIGVTAAGIKTIKGSVEYRAERGRFGLYRFSEAATYLDQPRWMVPGDYDLHVLLPNEGRFFSGRVLVKP